MDGGPGLQLTEAETQKLRRMEEEVDKRVIGQYEAIEVVAKVIGARASG